MRPVSLAARLPDAAAKAGLPTRLLLHDLTAADLPGNLAARQHCIIVTGRYSARESGALADITAVLDGAGIGHTVFDGVTENPKMSECRQGAALVKQTAASLIIGIGGGSPLDAAKAIAILAANDLKDEQLFALQFRSPRLPLMLVGTTAGTGSEVTAVAVITQDNGVKRSIVCPDCLPDTSLLVPRYTYTCAPSVAMSTALDALMHATEGYFSPGCPQVALQTAERCIPTIWRGICTMAAGQEPDKAELYYASVWAGITLKLCGTAHPHPLSYVLSELYHVPHGRACAVFLPSLLRRASEYASDRLARFTALTGQSPDQVAALAARAADVRLTLQAAEIDALLPRFTSLKNYANTPGGFSGEEAVEVYRELFL